MLSVLHLQRKQSPHQLTTVGNPNHNAQSCTKCAPTWSMSSRPICTARHQEQNCNLRQHPSSRTRQDHSVHPHAKASTLSAPSALGDTTSRSFLWATPTSQNPKRAQPCALSSTRNSRAFCACCFNTSNDGAVRRPYGAPRPFTRRLLPGQIYVKMGDLSRFTTSQVVLLHPQHSRQIPGRLCMRCEKRYNTNIVCRSRLC